jgi:predicted DNA binding CopG/RHH family protein
MNTTHYDPEELEIPEYIENGNPQSVPDLAEEMRRMRLSVAQKITKRKPVNLSILESDLAKLKSQALQQGIPCQTLIGSILHPKKRSRAYQNPVRPYILILEPKRTRIPD